MADEPIGSVSVNITGDYSELQTQLSDAQNVAQQAGSAIADAFTGAASGASTFDDQIAQMVSSGSTLGEALSALGVQANTAGDGLVQTGVAAGEAAGKTDELGDSFKRVRNDAEAFEKAWGDALEENKRRTEELNSSSNELFLTLAKFAGVTIGLQGLKEFYTDALEAFGALEKGTIALTALTGSGAKATESIDALRKVAVSEGLDFNQLLTADQRLVAFGVDATRIPGVLVAAANAAGATGNSFEAVANSVERIALSGTVMARQLVQLGLSTSDLAKSMDVSVSQVAATFKGLDIDQRIDVLINALQRFEGVGLLVAQSLSGQWKTFKTEVTFALQEVGAQIAPTAELFLNLGKAILPSLVEAIKAFGELSKAVQFFYGEAKVLPDLLLNLVPPGLTQLLSMFSLGFLDLKTRIALMVPELTFAKEAMNVFGLAIETVTGKGPAFTTMSALITTGLHNITIAATTGGKEFKDAWNDSLGAVGLGKLDSTVAAVILQEKTLSDSVVNAQKAFDALSHSYQTQIPLQNGYTASAADVARAQANLAAATAAAATTHEIHADKIRHSTLALREQQPAIDELVARIGLGTTAYRNAVNETAKFNETMGTTITMADMAAIKLGAVALAMGALRQSIPPQTAISPFFLDPPVESWNAMALAEKAAADGMNAVGEAINNAFTEQLAADPIGKLTEGLNTLGIRSAADFKDLSTKADKAYQDILDSGQATYLELSEAALKAAEAQIRYQLSVDQISREEADKTLNGIKGDLDQLDVDSAGSGENRARHERTLGQEVQAINKRTFDAIERGLANTLVNFKGWGELWKTLWQGLAKDVLNILFKTLLNPLEEALKNVLGGIFKGVTKGAGAAAGGAVSEAGSVAGGVGSAASGVGGAAASAGSSALGTALSIAQLGVSVVSGIVSGYQQAHMESDLQKIEESTRYLKIGLVTAGDSMVSDTHIIRNTLTDFMHFNWGVVATYYQGFAEKLDVLIGMGGIHSSGVQAQTVAFSSAPSVAAMAADGPSINVDLSGSHFNGGMTDGQVVGILNRGVRMSKLTGAFPPGRFPQ